MNKENVRLFLFRGKRGNEWEYGLLGFDEDTGIPSCIENEPGAYSYCDPETIGQYTGLNDKNGRKIFEGDILTGPNVVSYMDGEFVTNGDRPLSWILSGNHSFEVIGNIYDDPELLEL